ncbi:MAG: hypothetical protein HZC28_11785 [Spirochaetes bacterium]|nr:hypothetical protein [Spirochaetota bacterium]
MFLTKDAYTMDNARCVRCAEYMSRLLHNTKREQYLAKGKIKDTYMIERRKEYCAVCRGLSLPKVERAVMVSSTPANAFIPEIA